MTREEWITEGTKRFGPDVQKWKFVCPSCGHVASVKDYREVGAPAGAVAYSCIGRWSGAMKDAFTTKDGRPCNYAGGGLICINPLEVDGGHYFDFAPAEGEVPPDARSSG